VGASGLNHCRVLGDGCDLSCQMRCRAYGGPLLDIMVLSSTSQIKREGTRCHSAVKDEPTGYFQCYRAWFRRYNAKLGRAAGDP
jgi:hypothetical protein